MSYEIECGSLTVISGCMFSGKTNKLIELYNNHNNKENCLAINYILDNRYTDKNEIISHDNNKIPCIIINDLIELIYNTEYYNIFKKAPVIYINEAQFFQNLLKWCTYFMKIHKKHIVICGLDYDFKKQPFGDIIECQNIATKIYKLHSTCNKCGQNAIYTHRINKSQNQILIGIKEYIPVCDKCWTNLNRN